jgi:amino acid transporter
MSVSDAIPAPRPAVDEDELLRRMGITPVLARRQNKLAAWAAPFNIISVITGVVGTLSLGMTIGPGPMFFGWIIVSCLTLVVGVVMAELASSMPTAAALYHWTQQLATPKRAAHLSSRVGWLNFLGLLGGVSSVAYGGAVSLQALLALHTGYTPTPGRTFAITGGLLVAYGLVNTLDIGRVAAVNKASIVWLIGGTVLIVLVLAAVPHRHQSARFVLTHIANETGFHSNWYALAIVLACGSYVYCGYDLAAHLSEETLQARRTVPVAILRSISRVPQMIGDLES